MDQVRKLAGDLLTKITKVMQRLLSIYNNQIYLIH